MRNERVLVFENACYLSIDNARLRVERKGQEPVFVALIDIASVVIDSPQVVITGALLQSLGMADIALVITSDKHVPASILFPVNAHVATVERQRLQFGMTASLKDTLWQALIRRKIENQLALLQALGKSKVQTRLARLARDVAPGDPSNFEAQAAQVYWPELFGSEYRRDKQGAEDVINTCLNYGYTVVRALLARYVALSGLSGILGVGHSNSGNSLALVDDLIEPFRAMVDWIVVTECQTLTWGKTAKQALLGILEAPVLLAGQRYRLSAAAAESVNSYVRCLANNSSEHLLTPQWIFTQDR